MPLIPFPSEVDLNVESVALELSQDNRVTVQDRRGRYRTNQFGRTVWQGTLRLAPAKGARARVIESWLASMDDTDNFCDIRINRLETEPHVSATVTGGTPDVWTLSATLGQEIRASSESGAGRYVRVGNAGQDIYYLFVIRLYTEASPTGPFTAALEPRENIPVNTMMRTTDQIRVVKRPGGTISMVQTPDWSGPWQFNFKEYQGG